MSIRSRLLLLLVLVLGLTATLAGLALFHLSRGRALGEASLAAAEVGGGIVLHSVYVNDVVSARQTEDKAREEELIRLVRTHRQHLEEGILKTQQAPGTELSAQDESSQELRRKREAFMALWTPYADAVDDILEGRTVVRKLDFVTANAHELNNRMTEVSRAFEARGARHQTVALRFVVGLVAVLVLLVLVAAWTVVRGLLRPVDAITERMKMMSNGELPLELPMPLDAHDEVGELSRYFNGILYRLREADHTKDRFLATMSHEIRTPMNGVIGFLENLEGTDLSEPQRQYVRLIGSSARALLRVINEILDFSKLAAGKMTLENAAFDLQRLVKERVDVVREMLRAKPVKARLDLGEWPNPVIRGDPARLRQVLDNLLNNAVKFTDHGEICLHVTFTAAPEDRVTVTFEVADTGIGISTQQQARLFQAFSQAETTTTRRYGGTGLGLCISANLVTLMGGALRVESQPGKGSRFIFSLVTSNARPEEQVQLSEHHAVKFAPGALKRFWALLVDDTPTNLFLMETICQSIGLPYMTATNGQEAVDRCRKTHFDLVFMDIQMPIMDGYKAIREIRKLDDPAATQIIALTASAMQEDVDKALGAGSTGFMPKPFERNQLLLCIAEHLGVVVERELRPMTDTGEAPESVAVRQMYDFMREQYQISLDEIKMILAQSVKDWRPQLNDILAYAKKRNWPPIRATMHKFKGQLSSIGLPDFADIADDVNLRIKADKTEGLEQTLESFVAELGAIFRAAEQDITLAHPKPGA